VRDATEPSSVASGSPLGTSNEHVAGFDVAC